jgi:hypothetical protein
MKIRLTLVKARLEVTLMLDQNAPRGRPPRCGPRSLAMAPFSIRAKLGVEASRSTRRTG